MLNEYNIHNIQTPNLWLCSYYSILEINTNCNSKHINPYISVLYVPSVLYTSVIALLNIIINHKMRGWGNRGATWPLLIVLGVITLFCQRLILMQSLFDLFSAPSVCFSAHQSHFYHFCFLCWYGGEGKNGTLYVWSEKKKKPHQYPLQIQAWLHHCLQKFITSAHINCFFLLQCKQKCMYMSNQHIGIKLFICFSLLFLFYKCHMMNAI